MLFFSILFFVKNFSRAGIIGTPLFRKREEIEKKKELTVSRAEILLLFLSFESLNSPFGVSL